MVAASVAGAAAVLVVVVRALGAGSAWWALAVVWVPMTALGTISHVVPFTLPAAWHHLQGWEADGRVYERLGVRAAKRVLRRPPFSWFNPGLHLPRERSAEEVARLARRMMVAEATHAILFAATIVVAVEHAVAGWNWAAGWMLGLNLVINGYPVLLQRYNRVLLHRHFPTPEPSPRSE